jgi:CO/xanthine dehydrogenase Mo-binding subunit
MLWVRLVRSPLPHATIRRIDVQPSRAVSGVVAVLTAADLPGARTHGLLVADQPVLCEDVVRRVGDPIAIVVAESDAAARAAVEAIDVDLDPLPPVTDMAAALHADTPNIHPGGNLCSEITLGVSREEAATALAGADIVHESSYRTPRQEHAFMEVEGGAAWIDHGRITVVAGGQNPFLDRGQVAAALGVSPDEVRVINPPSGGAFGGRRTLRCRSPWRWPSRHRAGRAGSSTTARNRSSLDTNVTPSR